MDPVTVGISVGSVVVAQLSKKLLEKAADPEKIAKAVNWVFSAVENFLKIRKKEKPKDNPVAAPPTPATPANAPATVTAAEAEKKKAAVENIAKSLGQEVKTAPVGGVRLANLDNFTVEQLAAETESLMKQIETYLGNLRFEEVKAAQYGGLVFAPPIVMNTIRIQQEEIAKRVLRLNACMQKAYGVAAPDLDILVDAAQA